MRDRANMFDFRGYVIKDFSRERLYNFQIIKKSELPDNLKVVLIFL